MMRLFLIGMLCGVMIAAAFTYVFAIPANNYYWQSEIWNRGGAAWTFDMKSGHMDWKWLVEPKAATPRQKRVTVPSSRLMFAASGCKSASNERQMKQNVAREDKHFSHWHAVRSDDGGRIHVRLRNSGQQLLLANGNLETGRRSVDVRHEKWSHGLEMDG